MENDSFLEFDRISKSFPGVLALDAVSFAVRQGEIHALVGENGAGKTTLINLCGGVYAPDGGQILFEGRPVHITNPRQAKEMGISIVNQEFPLCPSLSVAVNVALAAGLESNYGFVNRRGMVEQAERILDMLGVPLNPQTVVRSLSIGQQQIVEIARALSARAKLAIMDEPTSALNLKETRTLFEVIRKLKQQGVTIIYVSHRMEEVFELADRITVLRDGRHIDTVDKASTAPAQIVHMMVGRELTNWTSSKTGQRGEMLLEGRELTRVGRLEGVSFQLRRGEILGLAGLQGSGNSYLLRSIFGIEPLDGGEIFLEGRRVEARQPEDAIRLSLSYLPADRRQEGINTSRSVKENIALLRLPWLARFGFVGGKGLTETAAQLVREFGVRVVSLNQQVANLSGGNQQKVVVAKWLSTNPKVLLMDDPTRGIDVGAKAEVHAIINRLAQQGIGVMLISSELPELLAMSDRIIAMYQGRITGEFIRQEATQEKVMSCVTGWK